MTRLPQRLSWAVAALLSVGVAWQEASAATFTPDLVRVCVIGRIDDGSFECFDTLFAVLAIEDCGKKLPLTEYDGGEGAMTLWFDGVGDPMTVAYQSRSWQSNTPGFGQATVNVVVSTEFSDSAESCKLWTRD